ncbi:MAG TPA: hypothetical protein VEF04_01885 [Blastocatellia bacterium]|nr:hypothetical protein [Blastocatellia bacterium]
MNYFPYFTDIEDEFIRLRGKHLFLSPLEWSLIETWKQKDIPLRIVLRGINAAFEKFKAKPGRTKKVNSLFYCEQAVEQAFEEFRDAQVGGDHVTAEPTNQDFSNSRIIESLESSIDQLRELTSDYSHGSELMFLAVALGDAAMQLISIKEGFNELVAQEGYEAIDQKLLKIEEELMASMKLHLDAEFLSKCHAECEKVMKPYRSGMSDEIYKQTLENAIAKRIREHYRVPRLSLFYL